jgi:hypothetical protein
MTHPLVASADLIGLPVSGRVWSRAYKHGECGALQSNLTRRAPCAHLTVQGHRLTHTLHTQPQNRGRYESGHSRRRTRNTDQ